MPRPVATVSVPFPLAGVDVTKAFVRQPVGPPGPYGVPATTPLAHNVRALEVSTGRVRGASRPGLRRWLSEVVDLSEGTITPDDLAGLEVWHDASDIANLWQDSARTTPVAADADPVGAWDDLSGNNRHLVQATAGSRGTYKESIQNSLSVVRLDGAADHLSSATYAITIPSTVFVVAQSDTPTSGDMLISSRVGSVGSQVINLELTPAKWSFGAGTHPISSVTVDTDFHVLVAVFNGTISTLWVDGVLVAFGDTGSQSRDGLAVGTNISANVFWDGDVGEVGIYNRALEGTDLSMLMAYLINKWGV